LYLMMVRMKLKLIKERQEPLMLIDRFNPPPSWCLLSIWGGVAIVKVLL
jgi:hypothetical protein